MILFGTIVNVVTCKGSAVCWDFFHSRLPERIVKDYFSGYWLVTIYIGMVMAMKTHQILILILVWYLVLAVGELIDIENIITSLASGSKKNQVDKRNFF